MQHDKQWKTTTQENSRKPHKPCNVSVNIAKHRRDEWIERKNAQMKQKLEEVARCLQKVDKKIGGGTTSSHSTPFSKVYEGDSYSIFQKQFQTSVYTSFGVLGSCWHSFVDEIIKTTLSSCWKTFTFNRYNATSDRWTDGHIDVNVTYK